MKLFTGVFTILFSSFLLSQHPDAAFFEKNGEVYFRFYVENQDEVNFLTNIISIDNVTDNLVYAYANEHEFSEFLKYGYEYEILTNPGDLIEAEMSLTVRGLLNWNVYPTYDAYVNMMYQFQTDYPAICKIIDAGNSVQGRKILFAKITSNVNEREAKPQFMYTSTMHGDETTGYVLMLRLIDSLITSYGNDTRITNLLNNVEIWINPLANPDGSYYAGNHTVTGSRRNNANNYDLNRNFPDPVNGVHSQQQQETTVFRNIQEANNFLLIANFHGGAEVVNYPWDRWSNTGSGSRVHADQTWYQFISWLYADTCQFNSPPGYMTYLGGVTNGGAWYVITGGRQDYTNYYRWGREVTIEISTTKQPPASTLPNYWEYNKRSFLNYIEAVLYGVKGIITDGYGDPLKAKVTVVGHDVDNSEVWSDSYTGFYLRMLSPGTYSLKFQTPEHRDTTISNVVLGSYFSSTVLNVQMNPVVPVPVELASFNSSVNGNDVVLSWSTVSETNNSGFEIEKQVVSGEHGAGEWEVIGFINGSGTTTETQFYNFTDNDVKPGNYFYRLKQIDFDGTFEYSQEIEVEIFAPAVFKLEQNYPNPFNPATIISYQLPVNTNVKLVIYDLLGKQAATLVDEFKPAGKHEIEFDASGLSSGVYFYVLSAEEFNFTRKLIFIK
jgi:hypothetical protein